MDETRKEFLLALGYAPKAIDIIARDLHLGTLTDASVHVQHQAGCGDVLMLWLRIEDDVIRDAAFQYAGCSGLQASASGMCELAIGTRIDNAKAIDVHDIIGYLDAIPKNKYECAEAARDTLRKALDEYRSSRELTTRTKST